VAASSEALAEMITGRARLAEARCVVEFGPGTGVFTEKILARINPGTVFFAMEVNPTFAAATRRRCPEATVFQDSAENTAVYLGRSDRRHCDRIICGLPWASFDPALQDRLLQTILEVLEPGGLFLTFAYLQGLLLPPGLRFRKKLRRAFRRVETTPTVWRNLPPAFVYLAMR
jgi:phospholipid N-methyltransferase